MKRIIQLIIVIIIVFTLVGCGIIASRNTTSLETPNEESTFKGSFSIGEIIEANNDLLLEGSRTLSGIEAGPREPFVQRHETVTIQVDSSDTKELFEAIISDVEESLSNSDATIVGSSGTDTDADPIAFFSYSYRDNSFYGVIEVWGIRGEETDFIVIAQITETVE